MIRGWVPAKVTRMYVTEVKRGKLKRRPIGAPDIYTKMFNIAITRMINN